MIVPKHHLNKAKENSVTIIGAGLCGSLLALRLAQRGYKVAVYEKRSDFRATENTSGRSINLALSNRGLKALSLVGLTDKVKTLCIPMKGRMLHHKNGSTFLSPYSGRLNEHINSISREALNEMLLNEAEAHPNVTIHFNKKCLSVDFKYPRAYFSSHENGKKNSLITADCIIATDGAGSVLRKSYTQDDSFSFSNHIEWLSHGYKELSIPPTSKGRYRSYKNALHIWPRGDFMMIALPNLDGSFTATLFLSHKDGRCSFDQLKTIEQVNSFFRKEFPDALSLMPNLITEFFTNPTAPLGSLKCNPWHYKGQTLLMGDAAHAIVPFYGQGMNAAFEDIVVLDRVLDDFKKTSIDNETSWESIFSAYQKIRKKDTDAIADLAIDNFHEMKEHVANPLFQEKRKVEMALEKTFPKEYASKYTLVTFHDHIGYHEAMLKGRAQDEAILNLLSKQKITTEFSLVNEAQDNRKKQEMLRVILNEINSETEIILSEKL